MKRILCAVCCLAFFLSGCITAPLVDLSGVDKMLGVEKKEGGEKEKPSKEKPAKEEKK